MSKEVKILDANGNQMLPITRHQQVYVGTHRLSDYIDQGGNASFGTLVLSGSITSRTISPSATNTYNLGSDTKRFKDLYVKTIYADIAQFTGNVEVSSLTADEITATEISGTLHGNADSATNAYTLNGQHASYFINTSNIASQSVAYASSAEKANYITYRDTRHANPAPYSTDFKKGVEYALKSNSADGLSQGGSYHGILTLHQWSDVSGGAAHQLGFTDNGDIYLRAGSSTWGAWNKIYHSGNLTANDVTAALGATAVQNATNAETAGSYTAGGAIATALEGKQPLIDSSHKLAYSLISGTPTIGNGNIYVTLSTGPSRTDYQMFSLNQAGNKTIGLYRGSHITIERTAASGDFSPEGFTIGTDIVDADATHKGLITTSAQTFTGNKTFNGSIFGMKGVSAKGICDLSIAGIDPQALARDYQSQASMDALLDAMGTVFDFTYTKTWNETHNRYDYTFTLN